MLSVMKVNIYMDGVWLYGKGILGTEYLKLSSQLAWNSCACQVFPVRCETKLSIKEQR